MCCRARSPRRRCTTGCTTPRSRRWAAHRLPPVVPAWRAASRSPAPPRSPSRSDGWCGAVAGASRPVYLSPPMLLAININNTETKAGLFRGDSLEAHWRLTTAPARTSDEWAAAFTAFLLQAGRSTQEVRAAVVASVVPPVTQGICEAVDGLVRRIKAEWPNGRTPHVIATGGLASLVAPLARAIEAVHPDLTLAGLRIAATALGLKW